jgi:class 3 adenylate cyclase
MALGEGSVIGGYRIVRLIGRGGMGAVYLADDVRLGRKVALKVLATDAAEEPAARDRFVRESQLAALLDHPHILPIYEASEADGHLFIAMRYVPGPDLAGVIARDGPLPLGRTVSLVDQIASALDAAHDAGLIHRDVKPGNILVVPGLQPGTDHAYLTDFGLTRQAEHSALTRAGHLLGSVGYVAPELIENQPIDARADIYSLGCVAYECLTGAQPYPRDTEMATLYAHVQGPPPSLAAVRPELPAAIDGVIAKAMAKAPEARWQSAGELGRALVEAAAPVPADHHLTRGFLFADLRGYTAYVEAHGDEAAASLLDAYRRLVRDVVRRSGGAEIRTEGDSFYVVFPSASNAVRCGLAITAAAASATSSTPHRPIAVGVGIHAGETAETAEGYVGSAVNLAARICAQAAAGEVLVSDTVRGLTRTSGEAIFTARGRKRLKGIAEPIAVYAATAAGTVLPGQPGARPSFTTRFLGFGGRPRRVAMAAVGAAGAVALAALLVSGSFNGGSGPGRSAGPSASEGGGTGAGSGLVGQGSPSATFAATSAGDTIGGRLVGSAAGPLTPQPYTAMELPGSPMLTISDDGWSVFSSGIPYLVLARTSSPEDRLTILWSTRLAADACGNSAREVGPDPEPQFATWAHANKGLQLSAGIVRQFGDLSATQYDVTIVDQYACQLSSPISVSVAPPPGIPGAHSLTLNAGERLRLEVASRDGLILILIEAPSVAEFEAFKPFAETVLDTLRFPPSATAPPQ